MYQSDDLFDLYKAFDIINKNKTAYVTAKKLINTVTQSETVQTWSFLFLGFKAPRPTTRIGFDAFSSNGHGTYMRW